MSDSKKSLEILLEFALDSRTIGQMKTRVSELQTTFRDLGIEALKTQVQIEKFAEAGKDTSELERHLSSIDVKMSSIEAEAQSLEKAVDGFNRGLETSAQKIQKLERAGQILTRVGIGISAISGAAIAAATSFANAYVSMAGQTEATSAAWIESMYKLQSSQTRVGRVIADEAIPYLEKAAALAEKLASWAEEHPEIIEAALKIAGAGVLAGGALTAAGGLASGAAMIGKVAPNLIPSIGTGLSTFAGTGAGVASLAAGSVVGGAALGLGLQGSVAKGINSTFGTNLNEKAGAQAMSLLAKGLGDFFGKGDEWFSTVGKWTGAIESLTTATQDAASVQSSLDASPVKAQAVELYDQWQKQLVALEEQLEDSRTEVIKQYGKQRADLEQRFLKEAFAHTESEIETERSYFENRSKIAIQAGKDIEQIEKDSQRRLEVMKRSHNDTLHQLVGARDALAVVEENRSYEQAKADEISNTNDEIRRRNEAAASQLEDLDRQYQSEKLKRDQEFALRQEEHEKELRALEANRDEKLVLLTDSYNKQVETLQTAFVDRITALDSHILGTTSILQAHLQSMTSDFQKWIESQKLISSGGGVPTMGHKAIGGYAERGIYELGEGGGREFVLNASTTRAAERLVGRQLSQESVLGLSGGSRNSRQGSSVAMTINLPEGGTLKEVRRMLSQNNQELINQLGRAFEMV